MPPPLPFKNGGYVEGRCGVCTNCILFKKRELAGRVACEVALGRVKWSFLTATYRDADLPCDRMTWLGHGTLFHQNLARRHARNGFEKPVYFHVGELGKLTLRPHFHVLTTSEFHWPSNRFHFFEDDPTWHYGGLRSERPRSMAALVNYCTDYIDKPDVDHKRWSRGFGLTLQHEYLRQLIEAHDNASSVEIPGMYRLGRDLYPFAPWAREKAKRLARDNGLEIRLSSHLHDIHELPVEMTKEAIRHRNATRRRDRAMAKLAPKALNL